MTKKKKSKPQKTQITTGTQTAPLTDSAALPPGRPTPSANAPAVPRGWKKAKWPKPKAGLRPKRAQIENATAAAGELQKSATYVEDFGNKAPDPQAIAASMTTASGWRDSWVAATAWLAYCSDQRRLWEEDALSKLAALKPAFDYASANDATIAKKYAATKQLLGAPSEVAQRGAAVRVAKTKAAKAAKAAAPAAPIPPVVTR